MLGFRGISIVVVVVCGHVCSQLYANTTLFKSRSCLEFIAKLRYGADAPNNLVQLASSHGFSSGIELQEYIERHLRLKWLSHKQNEAFEDMRILKAVEHFYKQHLDSVSEDVIEPDPNRIWEMSLAVFSAQRGIVGKYATELAVKSLPSFVPRDRSPEDISELRRWVHLSTLRMFLTSIRTIYSQSLANHTSMNRELSHSLEQNERMAIRELNEFLTTTPYERPFNFELPRKLDRAVERLVQIALNLRTVPSELREELIMHSYFIKKYRIPVSQHFYDFVVLVIGSYRNSRLVEP